MALTQSHFAFGLDDGTQATHTLRTIDTNQPIPVDTPFLLRFCIQANATGLTNVDAEFQRSLNGGAWTNITTTSAVVKAVAVAAFTNGQDCTKRLTGTGTFVANNDGCTEDGISGGTNNDIAANGNSETECGLQIVGTDVVGGDTIQFRLTRDGGILLTTYAVTPVASVPVRIAPIVGEVAATGVAAFLGSGIQAVAGSLAIVGLAASLSLGTIPVDTPITPTTGQVWFGEQANHVLTPQVGSLTLTGLAPPVNSGLPTLPGGLTLSGVAPTLRVDERLTPTVGSLTLSGVAPTLGTTNILTPSAGTLTLSGVAPTLTVSGNLELTPLVGTLALTGTASPLNAGILTNVGALWFGTLQELTPSTGSLSLTGSDAEIIGEEYSQAITPLVGSLSLAGTQALPARDTTITPLVGALSMAPPTLELAWTQTGGEAVTDWRYEYGRLPGIYTQYTTVTDETLLVIVARDIITAGPGEWYISVVAVGASGDGSRSNEILVDTGIPTVLDTRTFIPSTGSLTLSGVAPSAVDATQAHIDTDVGVLTLAGIAPTLHFGTVCIPGVGSLTLDGTDAYVNADRFLTPTAGALTLTGSAQVVGTELLPVCGALSLNGTLADVQRGYWITTLITPNAGSLGLTGIAPDLRPCTVVIPPVGSLVLAGTVPTIDTQREITPLAGSLTLAGVSPTFTFSRSAPIISASGVHSRIFGQHIITG